MDPTRAQRPGRIADEPAMKTAPHAAPASIAHPPIRLVALDLDGTLLREDKSVTRHTADVIARCVEMGVKVVIASARPPRSVKEVYQALKLDTHSIHYNGALIHDLTCNKNIRHQPMAAALVKRITSAARKLDPECMVSIEILDRWYTDQHPDKSGLHTETGKTFEPDFIGPLDAFLTVPVTKLMLLAPPRRLAKLRQMLHKKFKGDVGVAVSDDYLIQVMDHGVDKGHALAHLAKSYGVPREQVMAVGDAPNDTGMLKWAGLGVAMGNAWPEVIKSVKHVVSTNDRDGVAEALKKYVIDAA
jgi:Cof subfamily protein (haloacid dehalogenase superfamily)